MPREEFCTGWSEVIRTYDCPRVPTDDRFPFKSLAPVQRTRIGKSMKRLTLISVALVILISEGAFAQAPDPASVSGKRFQRIVIRNAIVIDGNGTPASGPKDIVIENDRISAIVNIDPVAVAEGTARRPAKGDVEIDAAGKYVMPGLINLHGHTHDGRGGKPASLRSAMSAHIRRHLSGAKRRRGTRSLPRGSSLTGSSTAATRQAAQRRRGSASDSSSVKVTRG